MNDSDEIYALLERIPDRRGLAELIVTLKREKREYQDSLLQAQNVVEELRNSVRMFNRLLADRDEQLRETRESLYARRGEAVDAQNEIGVLRERIKRLEGVVDDVVGWSSESRPLYERLEQAQERERELREALAQHHSKRDFALQQEECEICRVLHTTPSEPLYGISEEALDWHNEQRHTTPSEGEND